MILIEEGQMIPESKRSIPDEVLKPKATIVDRRGAFPKEGIEKLAETDFMSMAVSSRFSSQEGEFA
jgi:hypothetical protein